MKTNSSEETLNTIDANALVTTFGDCLYKSEELDGGEIPDGCIQVEGLVNKYGFHPERLESHRQEVADWLACLPDQFHKDKGGGWSFLNACTDRDGRQWGEHRDMECLFCLGIGLGLAKWGMPRDMWSVLPGGMPYVVVMP